MRRYPGNAALAPEVQGRIEATFRQTAELAAKGNLQEALLGCDFIARLDPEFEPCQRLAERLAHAQGPVAAQDLLAALGGESSQASPEPGADIAKRRRELREQFQELLRERRFRDAVELAQGEMGAIAADPELVALAGRAQEGLEAEPYLKSFLAKAREALATGQLQECERLLDKARSLGADHPEIAELAQALAAQPSPPPIADERFAAADLNDLELPELEPKPMAPLAFDLGVESEAGEAVAPASEEGDQRIAELLREGQEAFDRGEPQIAIDAWSRIFLIDIDNVEAARRIELARRQKAEREREVEEIFHDAVEEFEAGNVDNARRAFERVLQLQPGHFSAREYLERLAEAAPSSEPREPRPASAEPLAPAAAVAPAAEAQEPRERRRRPVERGQEIMVPPDGEGDQAAPSTLRGVAVKARGGLLPVRPLFLAVGGGVLLLVAAAGWYFFTSRERFFPRPAPETPAAPTAQAGDPIARARALHDQGKTPLAIAQLRRLQPGSPHQAEAQALISQWEALATPKPTLDADAPEPEALAKREVFLARARAAVADGDNVRAALAFEQAAAIQELTDDLAAQAQEANERLSGLTAEVEMFRKGEWEYLLNSLWRRRESEPRSRDTDRLMIDSYYNLALRDLQRGDSAAAAEKLKEALTLDPRDANLQRLALFARTYEDRGEDLLYRIFVKYLPAR